MATHSSILAWRTPGPGEPGGLPSMGSHRVGHDWTDLAAAAACHICLSPSDSLHSIWQSLGPSMLLQVNLFLSFLWPSKWSRASQVEHLVKNFPANVGDSGSIPRSGRSPGGGQGNPTPVFLPGEFHGQRNLVGYSPWGHKELDTMEQLTLWLSYICVSLTHFAVHLKLIQHSKSTILHYNCFKRTEVFVERRGSPAGLEVSCRASRGNFVGPQAKSHRWRLVAQSGPSWQGNWDF